MQATETTEALPPCCLATFARVRRTRRDAVCDCGDVCVYTPAVASLAPRAEAPAPAADELLHHRATLPGPPPRDRARVYDAETDGDVRPSQVRLGDAARRIEEPALVRLRRLLTELRPDRSGPLGWAADALPPPVLASAARPPMLVQTSVEVPAILPTAFASETPASRAPHLDVGSLSLGEWGTPAHRVVEGAPLDVLRWLQRAGTLHDGRPMLYQAAALAFAPEDAKARWAAMDEGRRRTARAAFGRALVDEAAAAWWGDCCAALTSAVRCGHLTATPPPAAMAPPCPDAGSHECTTTSPPRRSRPTGRRCAPSATAWRAGNAKAGPPSGASPASTPPAIPSAG